MSGSLQAGTRATRFWGLRRSGNHAIIAWIMSAGNASDQVFYNNCHIGKPAAKSFVQLEIGGIPYFRKVFETDKAAEILSSAERASDVYVSYEDVNLSKLVETGGKGLTPDFDDLIHRDVIITRSLQNWLASFMKLLTKGNKAGTHLGLTTEQSSLVLRMIGLWRRTDEIVHSAEFQNNPRFMSVNYDRWLSDPAYRETLIRQLGHQGAVPPMPDVTSYGGGSSFDLKTFKGRAGEMDVKNRWSKVKDDAAYRATVTLMLQDGELVRQLRANHPETLGIFESEFGNFGLGPAISEGQDVAS